MRVERPLSVGREEGVRTLLCEAPSGPFRQKGPDPFFAGGKRRGSLTIEVLLLLPIVLLVIWTMVEISMMIATNERLNEASIQGCRVASRGGNHEEIEHAVREVLGHGRLSRAHIETRCEDEHGHPVASGETVVVVVSIPAREAVFGPLCFAGKHHLVGRTVMRKE